MHRHLLRDCPLSFAAASESSPTTSSDASRSSPSNTDTEDSASSRIGTSRPEIGIATKSMSANPSNAGPCYSDRTRPCCTSLLSSPLSSIRPDTQISIVHQASWVVLRKFGSPGSSQRLRLRASRIDWIMTSPQPTMPVRIFATISGVAAAHCEWCSFKNLPCVSVTTRSCSPLPSALGR